MAKNTIGKITQVLGAVVDMQCDSELPLILNALTVENQGKPLVLEAASAPHFRAALLAGLRDPF